MKVYLLIVLIVILNILGVISFYIYKNQYIQQSNNLFLLNGSEDHSLGKIGNNIIYIHAVML